MEKTKIVEVQGRKFKLQIPTMRQKILIQSLVSNLTRGNDSLMAFSGSTAQKEALSLAEQVAELDVLVIPMKEEDGSLKQDFDFSFQEVDSDNQDLLDEVHKQLTDFISSFRKESKRRNK